MRGRRWRQCDVGQHLRVPWGLTWTVLSSACSSPCPGRCTTNSVVESRVRGRPLVRSGPCALSSIFFVNERFRDGELPEDSSSSAGVLTSSGTTCPFPSSSQAIGCALLSLSHAFFPRSRLFNLGSQLVILAS